MLKGVCSKCGRVFYGWALQEREHQRCSCGAELVVFEEGMDKTEEGRRGRNWAISLARTRQNRVNGGLL